MIGIKSNMLLFFFLSLIIELKSLSQVWLFVTPRTVAYQAPPSMEFSRQEYWFSSVQSLSRVQLFVTSWTAASQASLSITNSQSLLKLMSIESVMPSNHLILCHPLLLLPPIPPSIRVFSNESTLRMRWPKYWSFSFNISPSNEHPGLISFRLDWLDLLAIQGTLKSLLHHHSLKVSILWNSAFFTVQLSHLYIITGKTIALTRQTFVGKIMSLLFNMLSKLVITFIPRSKHLFMPWWKSHFLGRLTRSLGVPKERGVWNSQGGRKDKLFFPSTFLSIMYPAWGQSLG